MSFYIGQIFTSEYSPEAVIWCNRNNAYIIKENSNFIIKAIPQPSLDELKEAKVKQIDKETSDFIFSGFDYIINNIKYHFSYDSFDQQNFADTATMCQLSLSGAEGLPTSVTWNSYLKDGTLVQQILNAQEFLKLYTSGAMLHKATQMAIGGQRKAAVQSATTKEELDSI